MVRTKVVLDRSHALKIAPVSSGEIRFSEIAFTEPGVLYGEVLKDRVFQDASFKKMDIWR